MNKSRGLKQSQNRAWGQALLSQPPLSFQQNSHPSSGSSAYQLWDLGNIYLSLWLKTYFQSQNAGGGSISGVEMIWTLA